MDNKYVSKTKKDKVRDKNIEKMEALKEKFAVEQMPLAPINPNENPNQ
jgi:hypothetical protein